MQSMDHNGSGEERQLIDMGVFAGNLLRGFRKFYWTIFLLLLFFCGFFLLRAYHSYTPLYRSTATFKVSTVNDYGYSNKYYDSSTAQQLEKTFPAILQSGVLSGIILNDLGYDVLPGVITAEALGSTSLFELSATASDPETAYALLRSVVKNYPQVAQYVVGDTVLTMIDDSSVASAPFNQIDWKGALKKGGLFSLFSFGALLIVYALTRATIHTQADIESFLNIRFISMIPRVGGRKNGKKEMLINIADPGLPSAFREAVRLIRTRIEREEGAQVVMVTSALENEGKTTVAVNLSLSLASKGKKVILVDCDLRNPSTSGYFNLSSPTGLSSFLTEGGKIKGYNTGLGEDNLLYIPGGKPIGNSSEVIGSEKMRRLVEQLRQQADYVILDSPPSALMTDSSVLARFADGILLVIRQDYANKDRILDAIESLSESGTSILGCVINAAGGQAFLGGYNGYSYGRYGYGSYHYGEEKKES